MFYILATHTLILTSVCFKDVRKEIKFLLFWALKRQSPEKDHQVTEDSKGDARGDIGKNRIH